MFTTHTIIFLWNSNCVIDTHWSTLVLCLCLYQQTSIMKPSLIAEPHIVRISLFLFDCNLLTHESHQRWFSVKNTLSMRSYMLRSIICKSLYPTIPKITCIRTFKMPIEWLNFNRSSSSDFCPIPFF